MQQDLAPISGSAEPTAQLHYLYPDSLNPPYYPPSQNPNFNSNYNYVQSYCSNDASSLVQTPSLHPSSDLSINPYGNASSCQGEHQVDYTHFYLQAAATVAQEPNAVCQQYAMNPLRNTNQITGSQKHHPWKNRPKKIKVVQLFRCEICKVDCNSESVRDLHNLGNKHKKNLQKLDVANSSVPPAWCEVCKVEFNSKIVLDHHNLGKKHMKNLEKLTVANSNVPLAWCEVCQANYNSKIVLDQHKLGKKHKKNHEKLTATNSSALSAPALQPAPASVLSAPGLVYIPAMGPGENPGEATSTTEQRPQKKEGGSDDLETKKRKMLQEGAAPEAVCLCPVCNVICNSLAVFKYHLAGKKHAAMMKKRASAISSAAAT